MDAKQGAILVKCHTGIIASPAALRSLTDANNDGNPAVNLEKPDLKFAKF